MLNYDKVLDQAREQVLKAKPWTLEFDGNIYTAVFDLTHWHYKVYEDGEFLMNLNVRTATKAKKWLKNYLEN